MLWQSRRLPHHKAKKEAVRIVVAAHRQSLLRFFPVTDQGLTYV